MVVDKEKESFILGEIHDLCTNLRSSNYNNIKIEMIIAREHVIGNLKLLNGIKPFPERYHFFKNFKDSSEVKSQIDNFNKLSNKVFKDYEKTSFLRNETEAKKVFDEIFLGKKYDYDLLLKFSSISQNLFELYEIEEETRRNFWNSENEKKDEKTILSLKNIYEEANKTLEEVQKNHIQAEKNFFSNFVKINNIRLFETLESEVK